MLSDAQKRAAYDQYGHAGVDPNMGGPRRPGPARVSAALPRPSATSSATSSAVPGRRPARRGGGQQVYRGSDLSYAMEITLEEAAGGKETQIRVPSWEACDTCHGSGAKPGTSAKTCPTCNGAGTVHLRQGFFSIQQTCPHCHGSGKIIPEPCTTCSGAGQDQEAEDAGGEDPRRHQRRHAHPLGRQRRARHQRRPAGRPVHRDPRQAARDLRARRRRPALQRARGPDHGRAGRHDRGAHAGQQGRDRTARGHAARQDLPPARQGHQGPALELPGRPVLPRHAWRRRSS